MIFDERTWTGHPGAVKAFIEVFERLGRPIQWPIVGTRRIFTTDTHSPGQVVHWWKYQSMTNGEQHRGWQNERR
jgi:hypothetical protein